MFFLQHFDHVCFKDLLDWLPSIIAVTGYVLIVIPPTMLYLIKVVKLDAITAYFASAPGGQLSLITAMKGLAMLEKRLCLKWSPDFGLTHRVMKGLAMLGKTALPEMKS